MSCNEWKEVLLSDICEYGYDRIEIENISLIEYVSTANMIPNKGGISKASSLPTTKSVSSYSKGDILISNIRPYFKKIWFANKDGGNSNDVLVIKNKDKQNLDNKFLYYYLSQDHFFDYVTATSKGTKMPRGDKDAIMKYTLEIPPLDEQKAIAHILSTLDEKIEVNNRINKILEEMAQTIFKHWFIDFEFPNENGEPYKSSSGEMVESELGMIPKGWNTGTIGDYVKIKSGYAFKSSWWKEKGVPVIKIKNIENRTINFTDISFVSKDKVKNAKDFIVKGGELLIAMTGATIGKFAIVPKMKSYALVNQRVGKFFLGNEPIKKIGFIYSILSRDEIYNEIVSKGDGSAQPNISPANIENIKIILPGNHLIKRYNDLVTPIFSRIVENIYESNQIIELRDTLLPKLMSGEIRVPIDN